MYRTVKLRDAVAVARTKFSLRAFLTSPDLATKKTTLTTIPMTQREFHHTTCGKKRCIIAGDDQLRTHTNKEETCPKRMS